MKYRKTTNLLDATSHNVPRFITKKWIGTITVTGTSNKSKKKAFLAFKHNAPIISCISKINDTLTDNAEDLDVVIPI